MSPDDALRPETTVDGRADAIGDAAGRADEGQWVVWLDADREPVWADALLRACCAYSGRWDHDPVPAPSDTVRIDGRGRQDSSEEPGRKGIKVRRGRFARCVPEGE